MNIKFKFCLFSILTVVQAQNDASKVAGSWHSTLLENLDSIAEFSAKVMRSTTTAYLADQENIFKMSVKRRVRPLVQDDNTFEGMCINANKFIFYRE